MEGGEEALVSNPSYADLPPSGVGEIVDQLTDVFQAILSDLEAKMMRQIETMSQALVSNQDAAFQRLLDVVNPNIAQKEHCGRPAQCQSKAAASHTTDVDRQWTTLPDLLLCGRTESKMSQKENYRNLLHQARCRSRRATAARLRLFHSDQLVHKSVRSLSEWTVLSSQYFGAPYRLIHIFR